VSFGASAAHARETASGMAAIIKPLSTFFIVLPSEKRVVGKTGLLGGKDALSVGSWSLMFVNPCL
jgi:hypothetical protein